MKMYKKGVLYKSGREANFLKCLKKGRKVTVKQAKAWFDLKNPPAAILRFSQAGLDVTKTYKRVKRQKFDTVTYSM